MWNSQGSWNPWYFKKKNLFTFFMRFGPCNYPFFFFSSYHYSFSFLTIQKDWRRIASSFLYARLDLKKRWLFIARVLFLFVINTVSKLWQVIGVSDLHLFWVRMDWIGKKLNSSPHESSFENFMRQIWVFEWKKSQTCQIGHFDAWKNWLSDLIKNLIFSLIRLQALLNNSISMHYCTGVCTAAYQLFIRLPIVMIHT